MAVRRARDGRYAATEPGMAVRIACNAWINAPCTLYVSSMAELAPAVLR